MAPPSYPRRGHVTTTAPAPVAHLSTPVVALWHRTREFATRNPGFTTLVVLGAFLRIAVMIGYGPALWFHGDSGVYIRDAKRLLPPADPFRPAGYMLFLKVFWPTQTLVSVVVVQHLLGSPAPSRSTCFCGGGPFPSGWAVRRRAPVVRFAGGHPRTLHPGGDAIHLAVIGEVPAAAVACTPGPAP